MFTVLMTGSTISSNLADEPSTPSDSSLLEQVDVRRVQIDISVIDPRGDNWASVPDLPLDAFEVRLDGVPLTERQMQRVEFDEICPATTPDQRLPVSERPTLVAFVDHNFLDIGMRQLAADAIDDLADIAQQRDLRVKVISYTNRLHTLTDDFTSDPVAIRSAAARIREQFLTRLDSRPSFEIRDRMLSGEEPRQNEPLTDEGSAPRPVEDSRPAMSIGEGAAGESGTAAGFTLTTQAPDIPSPLDFLRTGVDPRPSLAAIEAVMLSHAAIRGRKALVVFTSSWFDFSDREWLRYAGKIQLASQPGFTVWTVDAQGLDSRLDRHQSRLLGYLSSQTGGDAVRSAGRLAIAFERALGQLSCYYLFSVPVEHSGKTQRLSVDVRLDTTKYPGYWRYRVRTPNAYTLLSTPDRSVRSRLAGLMEPEGYNFPEVRIAASYPASDGLKMPISVAVMLADLTFVRDPQQGDFVADFAWEGLVTNGREVVCKLGDGRSRSVRSPTLPVEHPPSLLVLNTGCALPGPGRYEVRAVVEDLAGGDVGASNIYLELPDGETPVESVSALRMGRNSGRDFLMELGAGLSIPRDVQRAAFIPMKGKEASVTGDQLVFRFVLCDEDKPPHALIYDRSDDPPTTLSQVALRPRFGGDRCREYEGVVPPASLEPGEYGFALIDRSEQIKGRSDLDARLERGDGLRLEFRVLPNPTSLDEEEPDATTT